MNNSDQQRLKSLCASLQADCASLQADCASLQADQAAMVYRVIESLLFTNSMLFFKTDVTQNVSSYLIQENKA